MRRLILDNRDLGASKLHVHGLNPVKSKLVTRASGQSVGCVLERMVCCSQADAGLLSASSAGSWQRNVTRW